MPDAAALDALSNPMAGTPPAAQQDTTPAPNPQPTLNQAGADALSGTPAPPLRPPAKPNFGQRLASHFADAVSKISPNEVVGYQPDATGKMQPVVKKSPSYFPKMILASAIAALGGSQDPKDAMRIGEQSDLNAGIGRQAQQQELNTALQKQKGQQEQQEATDRHLETQGAIKYNEARTAQVQFELTRDQAMASNDLLNSYDKQIADAREQGMKVFEVPGLTDLHQLADPKWKAAHPEDANIIAEYANHEVRLIPRYTTDANGNPIPAGVTAIQNPPAQWMKSILQPNDPAVVNSPYFNKDKVGFNVLGIDPKNPNGPLVVAYTAPIAGMTGEQLELLRSKNDNTAVNHSKDIHESQLSSAQLRYSVAQLKELTDEDKTIDTEIQGLQVPYKTTDSAGNPIEGFSLGPNAAARLPIINRQIDELNKKKKAGEEDIPHVGISKDGNSLINADTGLPYGQTAQPAPPAAAPAANQSATQPKDSTGAVLPPATSSTPVKHPAPDIISAILPKALGGAGMFSTAADFRNLWNKEVYYSDAQKLADYEGIDYAQVKKQLEDSGWKVVADAAPATPATVRVQIPGMPAGTIPASQLDAFKQAHPDAQVLQ